MEGSSTHPETGRDESEQERVDRNLQELLGELRVALPGVQVLFAFLLIVPFSQGFTSINQTQRTTFFVTLLVATAACVCLIAPTIHHRIQFRQQDKKRIVIGANRLAIVGLTLLAVAMSGAIVLITDILYRSTTVAVVAGALALLFGAIWYAVPIRRLLAQD